MRRYFLPPAALFLSYAMIVLTFITAMPGWGAVEPGRLDGIRIQAVENYKNADAHALNFGIGAYPLNPYYNGFSLNVSYLYFFNKKWGWEILNGSYIHTVKTDLTSELAEKYAVNPKSIEKLTYIFSTNAAYIFAYGKLLLAYSYIRYFRLLALGGAGLVGTTVQSSPAVSMGIRSDFYINDTYSWSLTAADQLALKDNKNYLSFNVGFCTHF